MRFLFCFAGLAAAGLAAPASAQSDHGLADRVDAVAARFSAMPITGMTIAVSRDGKIVHERGYGLADLAAGRDAAPDTVYEIGSITKEFTAAAVIRLAEAGRLGLDDGIGAHFPELGEVAAGVTVRHLLGHSSGLFSGRHVEDFSAESDPGSVVAALAARPREFEPGTRYRYNNNGYILLGLLIEKLSGERWADHLEREFFAPLGLESTGVCDPGADARAATGYDHPVRGPAIPRPAERHHPSASYSAGALCSTAGDLLRWQDALVGGRVVSAASFAEMSTPTVQGSGRPSPYGLGLFSDRAPGEPHLHHGGASPGFVAQLGYFPADRTGIAVLTNGIYSGAIVEQIEQAVLKAARGEADAPPARVPLSAAERERYAGVYDLGPIRIDVYAQGDDLRAQPGDQIAARLLHQGEGRFVAEHDPSIEFSFRIEGDRAEELVLKRNGRAMPPARRIR